MENLHTRLEKVAVAAGFKNLRHLERDLGMSYNTLMKITDGMTAKTMLRVVEKIPQLSLDYLVTGEGPMFKGGASGLPLLPFSAVAGALAENIPSSFLNTQEVCYVPDFIDKGAEFAIRVDGDSMSPRFRNGEILAIRVVQDPSFFQWGRVYVLSTTQGCVVKKLLPCPDDDNSVICRSENRDEYPDYTIPKSDILNVAIVVGHIGLD